MAYETGTAKNGYDLLRKLNVFMNDNGWSSIHSDAELFPDDFTEIPEARYWRVLLGRTSSTTAPMGIRGLRFSSSIGGPNLITDPDRLGVGGISSGSAAQLIAQTADLSYPTSSTRYIYPISYEFPAPVRIKEYSVRNRTSSPANSPRRFALQYSHDNITWFTVHSTRDGQSPDTPAANTWVTYEVPDDPSTTPSYLDSETAIVGYENLDVGYGNTVFGTDNADFTANNFTVAWSGLGYGPGRSSEIRATLHMRSSLGLDRILFSAGQGIDRALPQGLADSETGYRAHILPNSDISYWFYLNSHRLVLVTKNVLGEYFSTYVGFFSSFLLPDNFPNPCIVLSSGNSRNTSTIYQSELGSVSKAGYSTGSYFEPSQYKRNISSRPSENTDRRRLAGGVTWNSFLHPDYFGQASDATGSTITTDLADNQHGQGRAGTGAGQNMALLNIIVPTKNGELPNFPVTIISRDYGPVGALSGVLTVPGVGFLPEQTVVRDSATWRAFPHFNLRAPEDWFLVKED